jgi:hypothetical protein
MAKDAPAAPSTGKAILLRFPFEDRFECAILASYTLPAGKMPAEASSFYELIQFNSPRFVMAARWWCSIGSISFPKSKPQYVKRHIRSALS